MSFLHIAKELIAQQDLKFKKAAVPLMEVIMTEPNAKAAEKCKAYKDLTSLIKNTTGINILLILDTPEEPCTLPVFGNSSHSMITMLHPEVYQSNTTKFRDVVKEATNPKGTVDLKNAKVGGIYSKFECPIYFSFDFIKQTGIAAGEVMAIIMHEVGHCFLAFEFLGRTYRASQLLASLHQVKTGRDNSITYEDAITLCSRSLEYGNVEDVVKDLSVENDVTRRTLVLSQVWGKLATDFGYQEVAAANYERLADNFSARFGFAEEAVTGFLNGFSLQDLGLSRNNRMNLFIDSVSNYFGAISTSGAVGSGTLAAVALGGIAAMSGVGLIGVAALAAFGGFAGAIYSAASDLLYMHVNQNNVDDPKYWAQKDIYDRMSWRLGRMREAIVEQLKSKTLTPATRQQLVSQADRLANTLAQIKDTPNVYRSVYMLFSSKSRNIEAAKQLERDIEKLTNNDLFVSGNRLKDL